MSQGREGYNLWNGGDQLQILRVPPTLRQQKTVNKTNIDFGKNILVKLEYSINQSKAMCQN